MHTSTTGIYLRTYLLLLILLAATVGIAELHLGAWRFPIAAAIATLKTLLIMLVFMHVRESPPLTRLVAFAGFFWLGILFSLTLGDYYTR